MITHRKPWFSKRMACLPYLLCVILLFGGVAMQPAMAESGMKWYNPGSWWYNTESRASGTRQKSKTELKEEKQQQKAAEKAADKKVRETEKRAQELEDARTQAQKDIKALAESGESRLGAVIETQRGNITIQLYEKDAPKTVANFKHLVETQFYNRSGMIFHRVVPGFVVQTGDPTGTGYGGSKDPIPLEVDNKLSHNIKGVVAMARGVLPDTATSQFYITLTPQAQLDGKYAVFGKVISGFDVLDKIEKSDMLYGIRIIDVSEVSREMLPNEDKSTLKKLFTGVF